MNSQLILGSSGQIGTHLHSYIVEKNIQVQTFDIVDSLDQDLRIKNNNLLEKYIEETDFIYFLAFDVGGSRYLQKYQNTYEFINNNTLIMTNTFDLIKKYKKPFLFASSQMSNLNNSSYGTLKRLGEFYTKSLGGVNVKFWNIYGIEKDKNKFHVISDFIIKAIKYKKIEMLTDGKEERQFLYADDCSQCLHMLSMPDFYSSADLNKDYDISSFVWTSILDIANHVQSNFECDIIPSLNKDAVQYGIKTEPNKNILNYWKPKTSIIEGINKLCTYYKNYEDFIK